MEEKEKKPGFFKRLVSGLTKTRDNIVSGIDSLFSGFSHIDDDFYEELEEILIMGDLGVRATESIIEDLQRKVKEQHIKEPAECKELLIESIKEQMKVEETAYRFENEKSVIKAGFFIYKFDIIKACLARKLIIKNLIKIIIYQKEFL